MGDILPFCINVFFRTYVGEQVAWGTAGEGGIVSGPGTRTAGGGGGGGGAGGSGGLVVPEDVILPSQTESWMRAAVQQELLREQMQEQAAAAAQQHFQQQYVAAVSGGGGMLPPMGTAEIVGGVDLSQQTLLNAQVMNQFARLVRTIMR